MSSSSSVSLSTSCFFKCQILEIKSTLDLTAGLCRDVIGIVMEYLTFHENPFGAAEWQRYFGVDVGHESELPHKFYAFWHSRDPLDPTQYVFETHLPPVWRPRIILSMGTNATVVPKPYTLATLGDIVQSSGRQNPFQCYEKAEAFETYKNQLAGPACWLVMRSDVFARGCSYTAQEGFIKRLNANSEVDYEEAPSVLDLATVILARHSVTGERYLGDETGVEQCSTHSMCKETLKWKCGKTFPLLIGNFNAEGSLSVFSSFGFLQSFGIAALRKF